MGGIRVDLSDNDSGRDIAGGRRLGWGWGEGGVAVKDGDIAVDGRDEGRGRSSEMALGIIDTLC